MPANAWQPPQTGDRQLDRSFLDLADRLAGIDALLASVAIPGVRITTTSVALVDESYCEVRGSSPVIITLPPAAFRGKGRGALLTIQNFSTQIVTVIVKKGDVLNDGSTFTINPNSGALFSGNGVARWTGIKPGGGHVIRNGVVEMPTEAALNFSDDFTLTDDPANGEIDIDINFPDPPSSPADVNGSYLSGSWYAPGYPKIVPAGQLLYATPTANILWAIPHIFSRAGTITDVATYSNGNGGADGSKTYYAIYRSNAARTAPGVRAYSTEIATANFANTKTERNSLTIAVSDDELIWFAAVQKATGSGQVLTVQPVSLFPILGTNFDGTGAGNPLRAYRVGYRAAFTYAQPPDPWTATTKLIATDDVGTGAPVLLFKFTPS